MRRPVGSVFVVPAGALIAALTAVYAMAQPATRPLTLRPSIEDSEEPRETPPVAPRRADPRPAGALPNFDNPETRELPRFGNPSGFGAGRTGYLSTNPRVRPNLRRDGLLPAVKIGSRTMYDVSDLRWFIDRQKGVCNDN